MSDFAQVLLGSGFNNSLPSCQLRSNVMPRCRGYSVLLKQNRLVGQVKVVLSRQIHHNHARRGDYLALLIVVGRSRSGECQGEEGDSYTSPRKVHLIRFYTGPSDYVNAMTSSMTHAQSRRHQVASAELNSNIRVTKYLIHLCTFYYNVTCLVLVI